MLEVEFTNANFDEIKKTREEWSDKQWRAGVLADYDDKMAKGVLFMLELEKGLTITISDSVAKDDVVFINKSYSLNNNLFVLNFLIMGDVYIAKDKKDTKKYSILNQAVLHHSKSSFIFVVSKEKRTRVLDIIFSHEWLLKQFNGVQQQTIHKKIAVIERLKPFYIDPVSANSFEFVKEILNKVLYTDWDYIFLKPRIMFLIEKFVNNYIFEKTSVVNKKVEDVFLLTMMEIKQRINNSLYEKLPNKKVLAKEFLMSESTLDRHFKQYFGKTITEYYLKEKMEQAMRILNRNEHTIVQVAYLFGYETASAFIKTFKKHFGVPPNSLRKNNAG